MSDINNLSLIHPEHLQESELLPKKTEMINELLSFDAHFDEIINLNDNETYVSCPELELCYTGSDDLIDNIEEKPILHNNYIEGPILKKIQEIFEKKPYLLNRINRGDGKMDYIIDRHSREMLENAWQAINLTETWDFVAENIDSFMLSRDNRIWIITKKMKDLGYDGHSGFSFGWTMRHMQFLAQNGVEIFKESWIVI
jgi:hypothetical protein